MKTIYLYAKIHDSPPHLRARRRTERRIAKPGETEIAILTGQPDDYWERVAQKPADIANPISSDP